MYIFKQVDALRAFLDKALEQGKQIGFAPTMGALHVGHLSLIQRAKAENDLSVCSIFVNPTQFNDPRDLEKYPRPIEQDIQLLISAGCDVLLLPEVEEMYPPGRDMRIQVDLGGLDQVLEGPMRPGHFEGMVTIVYRLLDVVKPHRLYMGLKDFQQQAIVGQMIRDLSLPIELIPCPSVREEDGLAMSSRNMRLSPEWRAKAPLIYQCLQDLEKNISIQSPAHLEQTARQHLEEAGFRVEYVSIVNARTLREPEPGVDASLVALVAVWAGEVRLIDNVLIP